LSVLDYILVLYLHACCILVTFIPLSSRTNRNVYKYSYFPRTVVDWKALPDSARSAPSDSFHRLSTSPSNSHC